MKKILFSVFVLASFSVVAQVSCTIDPTNNVTGVTPTPDQFPCITQNEYYEEAAQILVPTAFAIATIDSFKVTSVTGIPNGMQYVSNPASQVMRGGERGCFVFYGTTSDPKGIYDIGFSGIAYVKVAGNPNTFPLNEQEAKNAGFDLFIEVIEPGDSCRPQNVPSSIAKVLSSTSLHAFVNSANDQLMVVVKTNDRTNGKLFVANMLGEVIASESIVSEGDKSIVFNIAGAAKGMYTIVLQSGTNTSTKKVMIR